MDQVIPFAVYEVITNHPLLREVEYESFEEVTSCENVEAFTFDVGLIITCNENGIIIQMVTMFRC